MRHGEISTMSGLTYAWTRRAGSAERKAFCFPLLAVCFSTVLTLFILANAFTISAEAGQVMIKYFGDIRPGESKAAIQFLSPAKGWVGIAGLHIGNEGSDRPCLLTTNDGLEHLHPVTSLKMPADYLLDSLFFLNAKLGWVVIINPNPDSGQVRLYRTVDGAKSWIELHPALPAWTGWVRFFTPSLGLITSDVMWRTTDGGNRWQKLAIQGGLNFFFDPLNGWVAGAGVVRHTRDGGKTWKVQYDAHAKYGARPRAWGIQFISAMEGWVAGSQQWLIHTTDAGRTWHEVRINNPLVGFFDSFESVHFFNSRVGVVSGEHNRAELYSKKELRHVSPIDLYYYKPYLLVTYDGGRTWSYHSLPVPVGRWTQAGPALL